MASAPVTTSTSASMSTSASTTTSTSMSTAASLSGSGTEGVVQSVTKLLEAQTQMVAKAMVAQSFPPLPTFTGESEEES